MSQPTSDPPHPFDPPAEPLTPQARGCGRPALIGCGLLLLLLGMAALLLLWKADALFGWAMERVHADVVKNLPADVSDADRQRLDAAFEEVREAVEEGRADPAALQRLQSELLSFGLADPEELGREDVLGLIESLEEVAAGRGAVEGAGVGEASMLGTLPATVGG